MNKAVPYSEALGFSKLYRDFVMFPDRVSRFFPPGDFASISADLASRRFPRDRIGAILRRQNQTWQAPQPVMAQIDKLSDGRAMAVFSGQQGCLFGGSYMILLKALATIKLASSLERELSVPVAPIFWIAGDDHDLAEVSSVDIFDASGTITELSTDFEAGKASPPVGALTYGDSVQREVDRLQVLLPDNEFKQDVIRQVGAIYRLGQKIVDCFARYLHALTGPLGLVLFCPYDDAFKREAAPMMQAIIAKHEAVKGALAETESGLRAGGYHLQVEKATSAAHLFYHDPNRKAVHREGEAYIAGETTFAETQLHEAISSRPLDFSPDVFTRPLVQASVFPTAAIIGGPAEIAYYAQLMPLFSLFGMTAPRIVARPSVTLVERRFEQIMEVNGVNLEDIAGDFEAVVNRIMAATFPHEFERHLTDYNDAINAGMVKLKEELTAFDPALAGMVDQTGGKIDFLLKELGRKAFAAHKKKNKTERERLYRLRDHLYPNGTLAERAIAPLYFLSRYGPRLIEFLFDNIRLEETGHQLLMLSDYDG